jgi:hypothetical protein
MQELKNQGKEVLFIGCYLCLFAFALIFPSYVYTADPEPVPPPYVPCDKTAYPEFHSLRPYQASPCNPKIEEIALFCGNSLIIKDTVYGHCGHNEIPRDLDFAWSVDDAYLPIMGNTEQVTNYQGQPDKFDDPTKVNEYVSWYLNGITGRAEYDALDPSKKEDVYKITDFTGPLKKLLSHRNQRDLREAQVKDAKDVRHDQVIGCVDLLGLTTKCYPSALGIHPMRLTDWLNNIPPKEENYKDIMDWWLDWLRWRGQLCVDILGVRLCIDNPLQARYWGNLYSNIPFSSTEDRKGDVWIANNPGEGIEQVGGDIQVVDPYLTNQKPADLFFTHMQEDTELADTLQSTYVAKDMPRQSPPPTPAGFFIGPQACILANVRSNPGDNLFGGELTAHFHYTAVFDCPPCPNPGCIKEAYIRFPAYTETPKADEAYSRLVQGPQAVFKRFAPQIGVPGSPFQKIEDIPGATKVTWTGNYLEYSGEMGRSLSEAELYFPRIGSVYDYFLKGIQTMLRPKGYGESWMSGQPVSP